MQTFVSRPKLFVLSFANFDSLARKGGTFLTDSVEGPTTRLSGSVNLAGLGDSSVGKVHAAPYPANEDLIRLPYALVI